MLNSRDFLRNKSLVKFKKKRLIEFIKFGCKLWGNYFEYFEENWDYALLSQTIFLIISVFNHFLFNVEQFSYPLRKNDEQINLDND